MALTFHWDSISFCRSVLRLPVIACKSQVIQAGWMASACKPGVMHDPAPASRSKHAGLVVGLLVMRFQDATTHLVVVLVRGVVHRPLAHHHTRRHLRGNHTSDARAVREMDEARRGGGGGYCRRWGDLGRLDM